MLVDMSTKNKHKATDLETSLKQAVCATKLSAHAVAARAGIDVASLLRFMNGQRTLTLTTASRLAAFLGLELQPAKRPSPTRRGGTARR